MDLTYQNADGTRTSIPVSEAKPLPVVLPGGANVAGIGLAADPAITDPDVDASLVSVGKGTNELLIEVRDLLGGDGSWRVISGNGTTNAIVTGAVTLLAVVILTKGASSNTLNLYDALTATGTPIGPIDTTDSARTILFGPKGLSLGTGLTAVLATGTGAIVLLIYRPA